MNSLMTVVAVANLVITALLLLVVLRETGKLRKQWNALAAEFKLLNQALVKSNHFIKRLAKLFGAG